MILNNNYKTVEIDITTYSTKQREHRHSDAMNENITERYKKCNQNRFICSVCLNKKASQEDSRNKECCKRKSKSCPICQKPCENYEIKNGQKKNGPRNEKDDPPNKDTNGKNIQTSQPDVTKGLTLLNEVLTVFQNKKQLETKKDNSSKTVILKDASVETDRQRSKPKLTFSKTFLYSLGENDDIQKNGKFLIINSQPETVMKSQFAIDLKHKSSSIPQMKLEELKQSLKEKTKSKDAIEEVNRMFAIVRKHELGESLDDSNRPMIRSGPRVLPVVKTNTYNSENKNARGERQDCCHFQTGYQMSSGDSMQGCCYKQERYCDNNCCKTCHYKHRCVEVCEHCYSNKDCKHSLDVHDG
ncbi:uncharacterized protein [Maniola hyperantus]|uniref:uncharacterized protein n=1 Tax=Aphantopus hyperantus TaxID=2795564 RepID=UPI00156A1947|nr:uncharacterized protein LOC117994690 [Maniola hyperantus]